MLYDKLCDLLERSKPILNWFALGEAKRLVQLVDRVCSQYRLEPDKNQEQLLALAQRSYDFLRRNEGPNVRSLGNELIQLMTQIQLENPR